MPEAPWQTKCQHLKVNYAQKVNQATTEKFFGDPVSQSQSKELEDCSVRARI